MHIANVLKLKDCYASVAKKFHEILNPKGKCFLSDFTLSFTNCTSGCFEEVISNGEVFEIKSGTTTVDFCLWVDDL